MRMCLLKFPCFCALVGYKTMWELSGNQKLCKSCWRQLNTSSSPFLMVLVFGYDRVAFPYLFQPPVEVRRAVGVDISKRDSSYNTIPENLNNQRVIHLKNKKQVLEKHLCDPSEIIRDPAGARTQDPILKRDVLYLLSY